MDLWVKVGYQFQINTCFVYYTTDGTNPEGAFGMGEGTTQVVQGNWVNHDSQRKILTGGRSRFRASRPDASALQDRLV